MSGSVLDRSSPVAHAAALAGLPGMGPARLRRLLDAWSPLEAWERVRGGRVREHPALAATVREEVSVAWQRSAAGTDPAELARRHATLGITATLHSDPDYPAALACDLEPPAVLFHVGDLGVLDAPRVAVVGTRRCTGAGAVTARELGNDLAAAGVVVVSGLALGIDGAAHRGALDAGAAPPVGVVANGLDVPYPARNRHLWAAVADAGLLLGEAPIGVAPAAWRFPARNRIIAALADVVVVVESHEGGGSMHTVEEAVARDVDVMAVPGSVRSPAAAGTNRLLQDGCAPVLSAEDVLVALGLTPACRRRRDQPPPPEGDAATALEALGGEPATLEHLALRADLPLERLSLAMHQLLEAGWVSSSGGWFERTGSRVR
jgi:DNA processing protein